MLKTNNLDARGSAPQGASPFTDENATRATLFERKMQSGRQVRVSFEIFPPKTLEAQGALWSCIDRLQALQPAFMSVTYGATGSERERTLGFVRALVEQSRIPIAAHLTCVAAGRADIDALLSDYWAVGVRHIVALRGDAPGGFSVHPNGYANATELTAAIRRAGDFEVSVGCYPEGHPESPSLDHDIDVLKAKQDAGASRAISQFFFEADAFLRFAERARKAGVVIPITPGVMPIANVAGLMRMTKLCRAAVPAWLAELFEGLDGDPETRQLVACSVAADLCTRLQAEGFDHLHFYTLNRSELTYAVCRLLGVRQPSGAAVAQ